MTDQEKTESSSKLKEIIDDKVERSAGAGLTEDVAAKAEAKGNADLQEHEFMDTGAFRKPDHNRTQGAIEQLKGSAKEALGELIGNKKMEQAGHDQRVAGMQQEHVGIVRDVGTGFSHSVDHKVRTAVDKVNEDSTHGTDGHTVGARAEHRRDQSEDDLGSSGRAL